MRLYEFEGKRVFSEFNIPIPRGFAAFNLDEIISRALDIGFPCVLKAQVLVGGRGKAGGIKIVNSLDEVKSFSLKMFSEGVKGVPVKCILVEEAVKIIREFYLSLTIDRSMKSYVYLASSEGGVDIEEIAATKPESIIKVYVDPIIGLRDYHVRTIISSFGVEGELSKQLDTIIRALYGIMLRYDADLVEINPLALTDRGFVALDSKITIDDNSLYRHPQFIEILKMGGRDLTSEEIVAREYGFSYVKLDGDIGIIGNGAGLTMASLDLVAFFGGKPANFLDIGGGARVERVKAALKLLLLDERIKAILINVYGGITRCDDVAKGIVEALNETGVKKPISVRLVGNREEEGRRILEEAGINYFVNDDEAAKYVVKLAYGGV
ncbi:MAG: ADP-forming succinate--CoA ligase subunit beta [Candidatus Methanomethylicia archaeon]